MIVTMRKVFVACSAGDRDRLLLALRGLGAVHLIPVDPAAAVADETTLHQRDALGRAMQILGGVAPQGAGPELEPLAAAQEALDIQRRSVERQNRLAMLHRQIEQLALWGDVRSEQVEQLTAAGIELKFYSVPAVEVSQIRAELVEPLRELPGKRVLLAVVWRSEDQISLPDSAEVLAFPTRDRPSLRAEAGEIHTALHCDIDRLHELANLLPAIRTEHDVARARAEYVVAQRGGVDARALFAVQGWTPVQRAQSLSNELSAKGVSAAVQAVEPAEDEEPPTLVRYPKWAKPIEALFKILGTTPGYREHDLSPYFMLALPIFTAMLIGDAGYGLLFVLVAGLFGKKLTAATGSKTEAQLILIFGVVTVVWGVLTGNYFGVAPAEMQGAVAPFCWLGDAFQPLALLWRADPEASRLIVIQISFLLAVIHLVTAHFLQVMGYWPHQKAIAELGWCAFLTGMFGVVWAMFSPTPILPVPGILGLLIAGGAMIVLFSAPDRNPFKRLGLGLLANIMPAINTFGDTISYIRLMAVGLASYYIASAFNGLGMEAIRAGWWYWLPGAMIFLAAHALNLILCLIAIFAHGVRLNMLEFSSNSGVQWAGHPYAPFASKTPLHEGER